MCMLPTSEARRCAGKRSQTDGFVAARLWNAAAWRAVGELDHAFFRIPGASILTMSVDWVRMAHLSVGKQMFGKCPENVREVFGNV